VLVTVPFDAGTTAVVDASLSVVDALTVEDAKGKTGDGGTVDGRVPANQSKPAEMSRGIATAVTPRVDMRVV